MSNLKQSAQAQRIRNAERQLERLDALREKQIRIIEEENAKMERLIKASQESAARMGTSSSDPPLTSASPNSFQSQFDQFSNTPSNERLESISPEVFREAKEVLEPADDTEAHYSHSDGDMHWNALTESPGVKTYVSGHYPKSDSDKQYEYELRTSDFPISVGDTRLAPVHPVGHKTSGREMHEHTLSFVVDDIYTKEKFHPYHYQLE